MPRIIRTENNLWHFIGTLSCGRFDRAEVVEESAFHETEYEQTDSERESDNDPRSGDYSDFCINCYRVIQRWHSTRETQIEDFIATTDIKTVDWKQTHHDPRKRALPDCELCGKPGSATKHSPEMEKNACPSCISAVNKALRAEPFPNTTEGKLAKEVPTEQKESSQKNGIGVDAPDTENSNPPTSPKPEQPLEPENESDQSKPPTKSKSSEESTAASIEGLTTIEGVGSGTVETLREHGYESVEDLEDAHVSKLENLPSIGTALSERILDHTTSPEDSLGSIDSIPGVGDRIVQILNEEGYNTPSDLKDTDPETLESLPRIGESLSKRLANAPEHTHQPQ